jgi:hypothetical protein
MSLWTPSGEHPVDRPDRPAPGDATSPPPGTPSAPPASGPTSLDDTHAKFERWHRSTRQWTILASGSSMMSVAPASLSAGMSVLITDLATTVSTA